MTQISVKVFACTECSLALKDEKFLKDDAGNSKYFHMINKSEAVLFCSCECCAKWSLDHCKEIWDRKS